MSYTDFDFPHTSLYTSDLREILAQLENLSKDVEKLEEWKITHEAEYKQLKTLYDNVMSGNFPQSIKNAFTEWMSKNALELVGEMVKHVYFGLNDNGYFVVNIPPNWKELIFKTTGWDYNTELQPDYGHLCILY